MAGSFGYDAAHYDVSVRMAELSLLPAVRAAAPDTLIVADGTSCRHQIADLTRGVGARSAIHAIRVLSSSIRLYVSGLAQTLITGAMAEPTTEPRPVENRMTCEPHAISSAISALSLMFGKPKRTSPSGTTSSR